MITRPSALRNASARIEALELRTCFSGEIDHAFGAGGLVNVRDAANAAVIGDAVVVQPDGKTVVAGHLDKSPNTAAVTRYNADGSLDTSFGQNGYTTVANVKAYNISGVAVLGNGKITVSGQTFFRLTAAGQIDTTFSGDGINPSVLAADRKAGDFVRADGSYFELARSFNATGETILHDRLFKYKADGTPDASFGSGGKFDLGTLGNVNAGGVTADAQGRVYVSFQVGNVAGDSQWAVARLSSAGKVDPAYGTNGIAKADTNYSTIQSGIVVLKDGRVLVRGVPNTERNKTNDIIVFSADGKTSKDVNFSAGGGVFFVGKIVEAADGSVYFGGRHGEGLSPDDGYDGLRFAAVQRLKADLTVDTKYSPDKDGIGGFRLSGQADSTTYADFALTPTGQVALLGESSGTSHRSDLVRLTAAGSSHRTYTSVANGVLTVNGSAAADHIAAYFIEDGGQDGTGSHHTVIRFDDDGVLMSADAAFYSDQYLPDSQTYQSPFSQIVVNLGAGHDLFDGSGLNMPVLVHGNAGNDRIVGTVLADSLYGDDGVDTILGSGGEDVIVS